MKQSLWHIPLFLLIYGCVPVSNTGSVSSSIALQYQDMNYSKRVGNVRLTTANTTRQYENKIVPLSSAKSLQITFDLLDEEYHYLHYKLYHCNRDWQKSGLSNLDFMTEYNEINIIGYEFSQNNYSPFVSYAATLAPVTRSGNYIITIFETESNEPLLSRRFVVYQEKTDVEASLSASKNPSIQLTHHQIDFSLSYGQLNVSNPMQDITPIVLQNQNWQSAIANLTPTSIQLDRSYLEYRPFTGENTFPALNNFRYFDIRSITYRGQNIKDVRVSSRGIEAYVKDEPYKQSAYSAPFMEDLNGGYYTVNIDPNAKNLNSEYVWINFSINAPVNIGEVWVVGKWNNWRLDSESRLVYDEISGAYLGGIHLKQGFYSYMYIVQSSEFPFYDFEGSFYQSENEYEILVYYREPGTIYDQVVGYAKL